MHQHLANPKTPFLSEKDKVCLYTKDGLGDNVRDTDLLFPFDVLQVPCYMDYDEKWEPRSGKQEYFFAHHVAAPDLSSDYGFAEYSENGKLVEVRYLEDMCALFKRTLRAQALSGAEDAVWVPLGMGTFLDKLGEKDPTYKDPKAMDSLRGKLADLFFGAVLGEPDLHVHLCLIESAPENKRAFESILSSPGIHPDLKNRVTIHYRRRCDTSGTRLGKPEWSLQRELYECGQLPAYRQPLVCKKGAQSDRRKLPPSLGDGRLLCSSSQWVQSSGQIVWFQRSSRLGKPNTKRSLRPSNGFLEKRLSSRKKYAILCW